MQITGGSLTGRFGRRARYWSERLLGEGMVHLIASDAHDAERRPPLLGVARDLAARRLGAAEAHWLVIGRPEAILGDVAPTDLDAPGASVGRFNM